MSVSDGGDLLPPARRTTQAARSLDAPALAAMDRGERRKLCHALLTETGAHVVEFQAPAAHDELVLQVEPLWTRRTVRVRVAAREVDQLALDRLSERVAEAGDAEGVMIAAHGVAADGMPDHTVRVVTPEELIGRLERSPQITWTNQQPELSYERVATSRDLTGEAVLLDPVGIRWLPTLALNELPPEIAGLGHAPQDLLERMTFRLLTLALRFGGERLGEAQRGHRLPDAVLRWDRGKAALLDCKAARDGYVMDADHELRFANYANALSEQLQAAGAALHYIVVVSSEFPGNVARHPHVARAASLRERAGVDLVYLRALDLARLALAVEASELSPAEREALGWASAFDRGLVTFSDLEALLP